MGSDEDDRRTSLVPSLTSRGSLTGWQLARTAFNVTRRLSMSTYMHPMQETLSEPSEKSLKLLPPNAKLEPTYRMEPKVEEKFSCSQVKSILDQILRLSIDGRSYNPQDASRLTIMVSNLITRKLKDLNLPRYRIVCNVVIGQKQEQSLHYVSQCIWNPATDTFIQASYQTTDMYATASVHGIYMD